MRSPRTSVLIVSAQFPFPPHSGFTMRVSQLARRLALAHDVTLLSYATPAEVEAMEHPGGSVRVEVVEREPASLVSKRMLQLASTVSRRPFSCRAVHSAPMQDAIDRLCAERSFDVIQLESSLLCAFDYPGEAAIVLDEHNVEYEVFQRMHQSERSLARRSFNRLEYKRFRRFEQGWWSRVDACVVTSEREAVIVGEHAPITPTAVVANGVDLEYFSPAETRPDPRTVVFNGILDYRPNLDAAYHLVDEVWPIVLERCPDAKLTIVGRGYAPDVRRLSRPSVEVTGEVPDIRPYLERATVVSVPIRMGGGTRLKVVEGLAMGKPMVSTTLGCEGVAVRDGEHLLIADDAESFAARLVELFEHAGRAAALGRAGRAAMVRGYSWELAGERLEVLHRRVLAARTGHHDEALAA